jgi:hypothetical protein
MDVQVLKAAGNLIRLLHAVSDLRETDCGNEDCWCTGYTSITCTDLWETSATFINSWLHFSLNTQYSCQLPWFQYHFLLFYRVFLVRDSHSSPGSFVLTFKCSGKVLHSQIQPVSICSVILLSKSTVQGLSWKVGTYSVGQISFFYGTQRFIIMFTESHLSRYLSF